MSPRKAEVKATTPKQPWIFDRDDKTLTLNGFITLVKKDKDTGDIIETTYLNKAHIAETVVGLPSAETIMIGMSNGTKYFIENDGVSVVVTDKESGGGGGGDDPDPSGIATRLKLIDQDIPEDEYELKVSSGRLHMDPADD